MGTCGIAAGARVVLNAFNAQLERRQITAQAETVGCIGICVKEPLVEDGNVWKKHLRLKKSEEVLHAAIAREIEAFNLYTDAAQGLQDPHQRSSLLEMAEQEHGHRVKLENILAGNVRWAVRASKAQPATNLRLTDHLTGGSIEPGTDFQDILLFAAKREKVAFDFYQAMAERVEDVLIQNIFLMLANEELWHKNRLETMYEDVAYQEF